VIREFPVTKVLSELDADELLPAILFRSSRRQCDEDVEKLASSRIGKVDNRLRKELIQAVSEVIDKYQMDSGVILEHPHYPLLLDTAVGAHHAGQLLLWRLVLEELMSRGMLRLMIATGTVAAGVDFPARSVVITAHSRRGQEGFQTFSSSELQQMSGRAGRRGKDAVGLCLVAPGQFCDARVIHEVSQKPPEPLRSAYFAAPATVLNLLKYRNVDDLRFTVSKSLASFLDRKSAAGIRRDADAIDLEAPSLSTEQRKKAEKRLRRRHREAEQLELRQETQLELSLQGLRNLGFMDQKGLSEKGVWAAELCTGLVLYLAEAIESGCLYERSEYELTALVASIAGDSHRSYFSLSENPIESKDYKELQTVVNRVKEGFQGPSTVYDLEVLPDAALTVLTWMDAEDWQGYAGLLRLSGVAEGDAARLISQTADHLHQLTRLQETHRDLARTAAMAREKLLRPPLSDTLIIAD